MDNNDTVQSPIYNQYIGADNYWFLYNLSDGSIYGSPYKGGTTEWTNIPKDCGVVGFVYDKVTDVVKDAFLTPLKYKVVNNELTVDSRYVEPTITVQPTEDEILRAKLIQDNANIQFQLAQQQQVNANLLSQIAKLGGTQ